MGIKRALGATGVVFLVAFGLIGFAHTPKGKPILRWLGISMGAVGARCPLGFDGKPVSPLGRDQNAAYFASKHAGTSPALEHPALGFTLDTTTRADVQAWAEANHVDCGKKQGGYDMACTEVPAAAMPKGFGNVGASALWLNFGSNGALLSVTTVRKGTTAEEASRAYREVVATLVAKAGPAAVTRGDGSAQMLEAGLLAQSVSEFRFTDYYAVIRVTNDGHDGNCITEVYRSLPKPAAASPLAAAQ
jgi:hypothetical protein